MILIADDITKVAVANLPIFTTFVVVIVAVAVVVIVAVVAVV